MMLSSPVRPTTAPLLRLILTLSCLSEFTLIAAAPPPVTEPLTLIFASLSFPPCLPWSTKMPWPLTEETYPLASTRTPPPPDAKIPCRSPVTEDTEMCTPPPFAPPSATIPPASATRPVRPPTTDPVTVTLTLPAPELRAWIACPAAAILPPEADCVRLIPPAPDCRSDSPCRISASA